MTISRFSYLIFDWLHTGISTVIDLKIILT